jgi:hypothetical protein
MIEANKKQDGAQYAVVSQPITTIYDLPQTEKPSEEWGRLSTIGDEGLYGQVCRVLTQPGGVTAAGQKLPDTMVEVLTFYGYHGYVDCAGLRPMDEAALRQYLMASLCMVGRATDVLAAPKVQAVRLAALERGAVLRRLPVEQEQEVAGWAAVCLVDGTRGYVRDVALERVRFDMRAVLALRPGRSFDEALAEVQRTEPDVLVQHAIEHWYKGSEEVFRHSVIENAKKYLGVEYRWGGKSGRGIDCSGLVSMAYMTAGVLIYRDAKLIKGWPMREIPYAQRKPGDALYFPGHIALYMGDGLYIHSTGAAASGGVVVNSLNPASPLYRDDLVKSLYAVGSVF